MPKALIIGGGVAGPAVALFLKKAGWDARIFEARPAPDTSGGLFLNVATNGLAVLETLGLRARLVSDGHLSPNMEMWSGRGRRLGRVPNGPSGEPERGSVVVRREWVNEVLRDAAEDAGIPTVWGARLERVEERDEASIAHFADGSSARGDVLIGCDGVGSVVRRWIDPQAPEPAYSGILSVGGFARLPGLEPTPLTQHMVFGARGFFGYLVREDGTVYWFANPTRAEMDRDELRAVPSAAWLAELREIHSDDPYPVPQILDAAEGEIGAYGIYDLAHVPHWHRGRAVAVGDAVHATSPSAGQGASLALEDAATLARCLRDEPDHERAFAQYERTRRPRAEEVVRYARAISKRKSTTSSKIAIALRDLMLPLFLRGAMTDSRNDHLYNHTVPWDDPAVPNDR
ncbi:2-polyprenyl-6-methoxyphenol hydroxylase-like FAD-dependent oxidoreductase [Microbacterium resistens]|uniref:2-polyprenyl-6-methoxyphenol hydroxylase-like FAD-dependent oxidoreductase n=1 Tax=Microbacterium resistens TaxID=156977 RepID=A0ABU1SGX1_9MICO|nr:NAD(P)/FAD-dependent oxidoreductase [Microbacterium resistens]MDR6868518.1 2-polyprenyl-6-methoxyphenol hydroxylase-like FAD-dependent oxidoreductase [Microbacterium resistens]